jgi:hypothetical protein
MLIALVGAGRLVKKLLYTLQGLDAAEELPGYGGSSQGSLFDDINAISARFPQQVNIEALSSLLECAVEPLVDEELLWSTVYRLLREGPVSPTAPPRKKSHSSARSDNFIVLHKDWLREYFDDALIALREHMTNSLRDPRPYYAKTLVFVQSSGTGKSRLADMFGQTCPMISYVLRDTTDGYPPRDDEILSFTRKQLSDEQCEAILNSPVKKSLSGEKRAAALEFGKKRVAAMWNHSIAVGLLRASLQICEFRAPLLVIVFSLT